jgi:hypothetical protein
VEKSWNSTVVVRMVMVKEESSKWPVEARMV